MKTKNIISAVTASLLLIACGGDTSVNEPTTPSNASAPITETQTLNNPKISTGYYVDSAVAGVDYNCTTQTGTTDVNGTFQFEENETCVFSIGGVILREVNASSLEHNVTIFEDDTKVAQFLQTLDSDGNASNGIHILPEAHEVLEERNSTHVPQNDAELLDIKDELKVKAQDRYNGDIVSEQDAVDHLDETRTEIKENNQRTQNDVEEERSNTEHADSSRFNTNQNTSVEQNQTRTEASNEVEHNNENNSTRTENNSQRTQDNAEEAHLNESDTNQTMPLNQSGTNTEGSNMEEHNNENNETRVENNNQDNRDENRANR